MNVYDGAIEKFGALVVCYVREVSIQQCHLPLIPDRETLRARRLKAAAVAAGGLVPAEVVVPECVDTTVFEVLRHIDDQEILHLLFHESSGEMIDLLVDGGGELGGWYIGTGEWRPRYSKERFIDYFADTPTDWGIHDNVVDPAPILADLPMPRRAIEELGQLLVRHVRDVAIQSCDLQRLPHSQTPVAKRWRCAGAPFHGQIPPEVLIPDCVDETIFAFLRAIDRALLPLSFIAENGKMVDLVKEGRGELASHYIRPGGWRSQYSKERFRQ